MTAEGVVTLWVLAGMVVLAGVFAAVRSVWVAWQLRLLRRGRPDPELEAVDRGPTVSAFQDDDLVRLPGTCIYGRVIGPPKPDSRPRAWPVRFLNGHAAFVREIDLISVDKRAKRIEEDQT